jgi:glutamate--cysteine ligase
MLYTEKDDSRLLRGTFGIEIEKLRVTGDGHIAQTDHPFPGDKHIVRDYSENQVEINSEPWPSAEEALGEIAGHMAEIRKVIGSYPEKEYLWPFSSPPYLKEDDDIPIARYYGEQKASTEYREYLGEKYGRRLMMFSGIHINYSFNEAVLEDAYRLFRKRGGDNVPQDYRSFKDMVYLKLAEKVAGYGWLLVALMAASPIMDASYYDPFKKGESRFEGMASPRCGDEGYWNKFVPVFDYGSVEEYAQSIEKYVEDGSLIAPRELYYPVRVKPAGPYSLEALRNNGISHLELRMYDLNPFDKTGIDIRDIKFAELFLVWLSYVEDRTLSAEEQKTAVINFRKAAGYDIDQNKVMIRGKDVPVREAGLGILSEMEDFYSGHPDEVKELISFQKEKLSDDKKRYACRVKEEYAEDFVKKAMESVRE